MFCHILKEVFNWKMAITLLSNQENHLNQKYLWNFISVQGKMPMWHEKTNLFVVLRFACEFCCSVPWNGAIETYVHTLMVHKAVWTKQMSDQFYYRQGTTAYFYPKIHVNDWKKLTIIVHIYMCHLTVFACCNSDWFLLL